MQFYVLLTASLTVFFGLFKFEIALADFGWPTMTIVFVGGLIMLNLLNRLRAEAATQEEAQADK